MQLLIAPRENGIKAFWLSSAFLLLKYGLIFMPEKTVTALEPSARERHGPVGAGPEESHKNDQRDETPLL